MGKEVVPVCFALLAIIVTLLGWNSVILGIVIFLNRNFGMIYGGDYVYVNVSSGQLRGFTSESRDGKVFYEFLGIPYASPPIGRLRFEPPVPHRKWEGVRDALGYSHQCWQYDFILQHLMGDEDCLTLNVFTPQLRTSTFHKEENIGLLPVLFYIHGGAFMFGRSEVYRPEFFMDEPVVLVTINYRLGPFGFLNTGDGVVKGNMGLKDQVLALTWVQENIAFFGGNPESVTLFGESAGAVSAHLHMLSPLSKGLFHKAISMSGSALSQWAFTSRPKEQAANLAKSLQCSRLSTQEMVECLKSLDGWTIAKESAINQDVLHPRWTVFSPTVELDHPKAFLTQHPRDILRKGKIITKVPWIKGVNSEEGLIYSAPILKNGTCVNEFNSRWFQHAPTVLDYEHMSNGEKDDLSQRIWEFYFAGQNVSWDNIEGLTNLFSDISFNRAVHYGVKYHIQVAHESDPPIFLYYYSHRGQFGIAQLFISIGSGMPITLGGLIANAHRWIQRNLFGTEEKHYGACHADEINVLFKLPAVLDRISKTSTDYSFSKLMVHLWATFARDGVPSKVGSHIWIPITSQINEKGPLLLKYMELSRTRKGMIAEPFQDRLNFWAETLDFHDSLYTTQTKNE